MLIVLVPIVGAIVGSGVVWEAIDRGFRGGFSQSGNELSGFLCGRVAPWVNRITHTFNTRFMKHPSDSFVVNCTIAYGIFIPLLFFYCAYFTYHNGFYFSVFWAYNVIRIGPYFMNFAYVYTMCHKEGHAKLGLWKGMWNNQILKNIFNWWIGLFYGVMPATFARGHSINHHNYNNGPKDVISTADKPRDSWISFAAYLPRYTLYSLNLSTILQFINEDNWKVANRMIFGTLYHCIWLFIWWRMSPSFAIGYIVFPF
jgi:hypothetical protein